MSHEEAVDITEKQFKMTYIKAISILISSFTISISIGVVGGDWVSWRKQTTKDVTDLKQYVYPQNFQAELNKEKDKKNRYAPIKTGN